MMFHSIHLINLEIIIELLIAEHLFAMFLTPKIHFIPRLFFSFVICGVFSFFFPVPNSPSPMTTIFFGTLMYSIFFVITGFSLYFCYDESVWVIIFCTVSGQSIQTLSSSVHSLLNYGLQIINFPIPNTIIFILTVPSTYVICFLLFSRKLRKNPEIKIDHLSQVLLLTVTLFSELFLTSVAISLSLKNFNTLYLLVLHSYAGLSCVFVLFLAFGILTNRKLESDLMIMNKVLEEEKKQYQISRENIQMINLKCHDLKHQLRRLRVNQASIDRDELKEIEDAIGLYDSVARTGNDALDVILTEKCMLCEKENIQLTCMAQGEKIAFLSPSDIYSMFGNALDNAIEAVMRLPNSEKRNISINIRENYDLLIIHVENYYDGLLRLKDGFPQTIKDSSMNHGFGMKSMRLIAEKYKGYITFHTNDNIFYLDIIIPIPKHLHIPN